MTPPKYKRQIHARTTQRRSALISNKLITNFGGRWLWQEHADVSKETVWALYNNGRNLYLDPLNSPATTYYERPWEHLPYRMYSVPRRIASSNKLDNMILQTSGHDRLGNVGVMFGCNPIQHFIVPAMHILYVTIKGEIKVTSSLLQFQPLPNILVPIRDWS